MKQWKNRVLASLLCLLLGTLLCTPVLAAGPIDLGRDVTLTLNYQEPYGDTPVPNALFDLYYVATVDSHAYSDFTLTGDFSGYPVEVDDLDAAGWAALAQTLQGYVRRDQLKPMDSGRTGQDGKLKFPTDGSVVMRPGLYLVLGSSLSRGGYIYNASPVMVSLPAADWGENRFEYDVVSQVKYTRIRIPNFDDTVERHVLKVWEDEGFEERRPENITVRLLRDDTVFDTVVLSESNSWRHHWTGLSAGHQWTLAEDAVEGYHVTVTQEGITFKVTNQVTEDIPPDTPPGQDTPPDEPSPTPPPVRPPKLPQTGLLWWPVPVLSAAGLLFLTVGILRRRGDEDA